MVAYILLVVACFGAILYTEITSSDSDNRLGQIAENTLEEVTRIDINGDGKIGKCPADGEKVEKK